LIKVVELSDNLSIGVRDRLINLNSRGKHSALFLHSVHL